MTEAKPVRRPSWGTAALVLISAALALGLFAGAWRLGTVAFAPGGALKVPGELQEVQTTFGTYVGRIRADDGAYITLADPAVVQVETISGTTEPQVVVRSLRAEPYGLGSEILIDRRQVVLIAAVAPDSQLARAYRQAQGG